MAQADVGGALAGSGEEHLGGRAVAVLLEEVVFDLPDVVEAQSVGQLDLVEGVLEQLVLVALFPWPGNLVLVEDAELHRSDPRTAPSPEPDRRVRCAYDRLS